MCKSDIYEVYNPNKSGSMLFYSKDGKYLVKTLTGPQRLCFSQMMEKNRGSQTPRYSSHARACFVRVRSWGYKSVFDCDTEYLLGQYRDRIRLEGFNLWSEG